MKVTRMLHVMTLLSVIIFSAILSADDSLGRFTQPTIDGKTINSETLKGVPLVINFSSPW